MGSGVASEWEQAVLMTIRALQATAAAASGMAAAVRQRGYHDWAESSDRLAQHAEARAEALAAQMWAEARSAAPTPGPGLKPPPLLVKGVASPPLAACVSAAMGPAARREARG